MYLGTGIDTWKPEEAFTEERRKEWEADSKERQSENNNDRICAIRYGFLLKEISNSTTTGEKERIVNE